MNRRRILSVAIVALGLIALVICQTLLRKHITGSSGAAWFDAGCPDDDQAGAANCAAVLQSPYSYFPPKHPDEPPGRPHVPAAFLGVLYYSALLVWFIAIGIAGAVTYANTSAATFLHRSRARRFRLLPP